MSDTLTHLAAQRLEAEAKADAYGIDLLSICPDCNEPPEWCTIQVRQHDWLAWLR